MVPRPDRPVPAAAAGPLTAAVGIGSESVGFGATFAALAAGLVVAALGFGALVRTVDD